MRVRQRLTHGVILILILFLSPHFTDSSCGTLNLAVFQKRITTAELQSAWQELENDIKAGLLVTRGGLWHRVLVDAESLTNSHTSAIGCRTLDILHVAAARLIGVTEFCTFDVRQAELAKKVGLTVVTQ